MQANDYDSFAQAYSADDETNPINGYHERPAMVGLAADVRGHRVLDVGCGSGPLAAQLRARGAAITGLDASAAMIEPARRRLGEGADLHVADLAQSLPFADGAFDDVVASLVLHYLRDWSAPLVELRRVLRSGGRLIVSVHHPIMHKMANPEADYFAEALTDAGFAIAAISEPPYAPDTPPELVPDRFKERAAFLSSIFFVLAAR